MKKNIIQTALNVWLRAFIILALVFLVLGLGSLGSMQSVGRSYVAQASQGVQRSGIVFYLTDKGHGEEGHEHKNLYVKNVYINIGTIYAEYGEKATVRLARGGNASSSFLSYVELSVVNVAETEDDGAQAVCHDDLFNWLKFPVSASGWRVDSFNYYQLSADKPMLFNEIVFEGDLKGDDGEWAGKPEVVRATVYQSEQHENETKDDANKRAQAVVDSQHIPSLAQSSFFRFGREETFSLFSVAEARQGGSVSEGNVYHADKIYGAFGTDLLTLGVLIFGMSPFGLRALPMLAAFGALIFCFLFVRKLLKSDKAAFAFSLLFALSGTSLSLAHFGTPLMFGVFFFTAALYFVYSYFEEGMKKASFAGALPVVLGGLFSAAAICVNGAYVIPVIGLVGLFAAGYVRRLRTEKAELAREAEEYESRTEKGGAEEKSGKEQIAKKLAEHNFKKKAAPVFFSVFLVLGAFLLSMFAFLPVNAVYVKAFDNPSTPVHGPFYFLWTSFVGGFTGVNLDLSGAAQPNAWAPLYELFRGAGEVYAFTAAGALVSLVALLIGIAGGVYALVKLFKRPEGGKGELVTVLLLVVGMALSVVTAFFAKGGIGFLFLGFIFLFALGAYLAKDLFGDGERAVAGGKKILVGCLAALGVYFLLTAVFTFSVPLPAAFLDGLLGGLSGIIG